MTVSLLMLLNGIVKWLATNLFDCRLPAELLLLYHGEDEA